jgi:NTE family protein
MPDGYDVGRSGTTISLVLAGGVSLGAYEAGAYASLHESGVPLPSWLAGSSIGSVNAAIIAGNAPERRIERLKQFWETVTANPMPLTSFWLGTPEAGPLRQAHNQASVLQTLFFGRPGIFRPRVSPGVRAGVDDVSALYDLAPLRSYLPEIVDFDLLNSGTVRVSIVTTDVVTGERVVFDTGRGTRLGPDHILASCALLPLFAPVEIDGRLLGDGGMSSNAPLDVVLEKAGTAEMLCFVVDLFASEGSRPHSLSASLSRAGDLAFGNQSRRLLEGQEREHTLRTMIGRLGARLPPELRDDSDIASIIAEGRTQPATVIYLSYRAGLDEAGPAKVFDFSRATFLDRWHKGEREMQAALSTLAKPATARTLSATA